MAWHKNFDVRVWIPLITYGIVCSLLILLAICYMWRLVYSKCTNFVQTMSDRSMLALFCFFIASTCNCCYILFNKLPNFAGDKETKITLNFWSLFNTFWSLGYLFTYILFWQRLIESLQNTILKTSKKVSNFYYFLLVIYICSQWANSIIWSLVAIEQMSWQQYNIYYPIFLWIRLVSDVIINALLVWQFTSKIYRFTVSRLKDHNEEFGLMRLNTSRQMHEKGLNRQFGVMVKQFLLSFVTILSTTIMTGCELTLSLSIDHATATKTFEFYYLAYIFYFFSQSTDAVVSTMYIVLSFDHTYYRNFCGFGHDVCEKMWNNVVKKGVNREMNESDSESMHLRVQVIQ